MPYLHAVLPVRAFSAYTLSSYEPTYTTPFATAGMPTTKPWVVYLHFSWSLPTLWTLSTFSYRFQRSMSSRWNCLQLD